jgi:outer membrane protein assembly factor BamB
MNFKLLIYLTFLMASCKEKTPTPPTPIVVEDNPAFPKLIWKTRLADSFISSSILPIVYQQGNKVIYTKQEASDNSPKLISLNADSGEKLATLSTEISEFYHRTTWKPYNNIVGLSSGSNMFGLDLNSLTKTWRFKASNSSRIAVDHFGKYLFVPLIDYNSNNKEIQVLVRFDVTTGKCDTLTIENETGNFTLQHVIPKCMVNAQNDTVVYVAAAWQNNATSTGSLRLYTINLRTKVKSSPVHFDYFINANPLEIDGDLFYRSVGSAQGEDFMVCLNIKTGQEVWKIKPPREVATTPIIFRDGKLFTNIEDRFLRAYDAKTGQQLWEVPSSNLASRLIYYKNSIYCIAKNELVGIEANTGMVKFRMPAPEFAKNSNLFFSAVIAIDETKGRLYLHDFANAMCYQLKD